jgi:hypothetical protein
MPSWLVDKKNDQELNPLNILWQALGVLNDFKENHALPASLILSDRSMCVCPHLGMTALNSSYFKPAYVELMVGYEWQGILVLHILQSQKLDPKSKSSHTINRCTCMDVVDMVRWTLGPNGC